MIIDTTVSEGKSSLGNLSASTCPEIESSSHNLLAISEPPDWPVDDGFDPRDIGMSFFRRFLHWGPILAITLILSIGLSTTVVLFHYWNPFEYYTGIPNLIIFFFWNVASLTNYCQASTLGGGYIKKGWVPKTKEWHDKLQYCLVCEGYKAPRSHHCSKCNRCVLKMDHHCPWLNNCVGHRNHAMFVKFMLSAIAGCLQAFSILAYCVIRTVYILYTADERAYFRSKDIPIHSVTIFVLAILGGLFSLAVIIPLSILIYGQYTTITNNCTYIEEYITAKAYHRCANEDKDFEYPYDLGYWKNVHEVFGSGKFPKGNGFWWPVKHGCDQFTFSLEQLQQKKDKNKHGKLYEISRDYNGRCWTTFKFGWRVFCSQPKTDFRRPNLKANEIWKVYRGSRHWLYGRKMKEDPPGSENYVYADYDSRGWFPRACIDVKKSQ